MKNKIKTLIKGKKKLLIIAIIPIIILVLVVTLIMNISGKDTLICTKEIEYIKGISLEEKAIITTKKNKVKSFDIDKTITLDSYYQQFEIYEKTLTDHIKSSYQYLDKKAYKITTEEEKINVKVKTKEKGLVLNNLEITILDEKNKNDIQINSVNVLETSSSRILIDEEYKIEELEKKVEGLGYKCKIK